MHVQRKEASGPSSLVNKFNATIVPGACKDRPRPPQVVFSLVRGTTRAPSQLHVFTEGGIADCLR
eukprot:6257943-Amphidinium_carterae.1